MTGFFDTGFDPGRSLSDPLGLETTRSSLKIPGRAYFVPIDEATGKRKVENQESEILETAGWLGWENRRARARSLRV